MDVENPNEDGFVPTETLLEWFQNADKTSLMSEEELDTYNHLPDEIKIYRCVGAKSNPKGFSWAANIEVAERFAEKYSLLGGDSYIATAIVKKEDVMAYLSRRDEDEYIVNGNKLDIHEID